VSETGSLQAQESSHAAKQRRRGMYIVPSVFTAGNIAAGYFAITQSLQGSILEPQHFNYAALAIGFAIPFDTLDGRIARMTNTTSDFGKELDSLADVITAGVLLGLPDAAAHHQWPGAS
jgi:CDP-diacylglycerol--serine O-phosphatidyltransferase